MLAHFLGLTDAADAFAAAFRIPNFLQNLFGEGVLSASFIPVYARLEAQGRHEESRRVAGAVAGLLGLAVAALVALGVTTTPWLVYALAPGFAGAKRALAIELVRILFPGVGLLVLTAWCMGVLNSHRKFFLSYAAPVVWNAAIIAATLLAGRGAASETLVLWAAWGAVAGSLLQLGIQVPRVWRLTGGIPLSIGGGDPNVRTVLSNFLPAFVTRGAVQISAFIDAILASLLPTGAVAALANAQTLYTLPVSLFGMSVAAAELPELSAAAATPESAHLALRERLERGMRQVAYFIVPSAVALAALGQVIAAAIFQTGVFTRADSRYVWAILAGSAVGLLASTLGRLYSSAWYALHDTRTPLRYALRVLDCPVNSNLLLSRVAAHAHRHGATLYRVPHLSEIRLRRGQFPPVSERPGRGWRLKFRGYDHEDILARSVKTDAAGNIVWQEAFVGEDIWSIDQTTKKVTSTKGKVVHSLARYGRLASPADRTDFPRSEE